MDGLKLAQTRAMLDELSAPGAGQSFVPMDYRYTPNAGRFGLREDVNEREARILQRLDGANS